MNRLRYILSCVLMMLACIASARTVRVSNASAINNGAWTAGDTLLMYGGTWTDQKITFKGTGTDADPIVLMASQPGDVILTGSSILTLQGTYLVVDGITMTGVYTGTSHLITFAKASRNCRLTNSSILSYNLVDTSKDTKWVSIHGQDNCVDHCHFEGKQNIGTMMVVWLVSGVEARHHIHHNYFGFRNPLLDSKGSELNGQETIRIGDSSTSMTNANCVVEYNYFTQCNGEIEVVSNKSCGNRYYRNTFESCRGMLTLRHGNNCTVEENFFLGNDTTDTGGVRIIGEGHTVINNYMERLRGSNYRAALCVVRGKQNSELSEYFQVKNALVSGNVFVNCKQAFCINYNSSSECKMPVIASTIANNRVYLDSDNKNNQLVYMADPVGLDITWTTNAANLLGVFKNTTQAATDFTIDANMQAPAIAPWATAQNTGPGTQVTTMLSSIQSNQKALKIITPDSHIRIMRNGQTFDIRGNKTN